MESLVNKTLFFTLLFLLFLLPDILGANWTYQEYQFFEDNFNDEVVNDTWWYNNTKVCGWERLPTVYYEKYDTYYLFQAGNAIQVVILSEYNLISNLSNNTYLFNYNWNYSLANNGRIFYGLIDETTAWDKVTTENTISCTPAPYLWIKNLVMYNGVTQQKSENNWSSFLIDLASDNWTITATNVSDDSEGTFDINQFNNSKELFFFFLTSSESGLPDEDWVTMQILYYNLTCITCDLISNLSLLYENSTTRVAQFYIENNLQYPLDNLYWQVDTGEENISSLYNITLDNQSTAFVFVEYPYSTPDDYTLIATAKSGTIHTTKYLEVETLNLLNLSVIDSNETKRAFEFSINNTMSPNAKSFNNITWSIDTGEANITSTTPVTLDASKHTFVYADYNYTNAGNYTVIADATNGISYDKETIELQI